MQFSQTLRKLRKEKNMTQEELAKFLSVSYQTISKWENAGGYPDVSLLPRIATFFEISIDELLGVTESKKEVRLKDIHAQWEQNNCKNNHEDNIVLLRQAITIFPGDYLLLAELVVSLEHLADLTKDAAAYNEAIEISNRILKFCTDRSICNAIQSNLCFLHGKLGDKRRAIEMADSLPSLTKSREITRLLVLDGENKVCAAQEVLAFGAWSIHYATQSLASSEHYTTDEKLLLLDRCAAAFEALCPEQFSLRIHTEFENRLTKIRLLLAEGREAEAVACAEEALQSVQIEHIKAYHTSIAFDMLSEHTLDGYRKKTTASNARRLHRLLEGCTFTDSAYDILRKLEELL